MSFIVYPAQGGVEFFKSLVDILKNIKKSFIIYLA